MTKNNLPGLFVTGLAFTIFGCSALPDRVAYPTDMDNIKEWDEKHAEEVGGSKTAKAGEEIGTNSKNPSNNSAYKNNNIPAGTTGTNNNAAAGATATGATAASSTGKIDQENYNRQNDKYLGGTKLRKKDQKGFPKNRVRRSPKGHNALTKTYDVPYAVLWNNMVEVMLHLPLKTVSKDSGIMTTDWVMQEMDAGTIASINVFGDGQRLIRFKYTIRVYDLGKNKSEVTVIPFAQVSKNRRWHEGKPAVAITERLFWKILEKMDNIK